MASKKKVIILGKLPPPYIGPSVATQIILNSDLKNRFELIHLNTKINDELSSFGRISFRKVARNFTIYRRLIKLIKKHRPDLILIPISQTKTGFIKDSFYISIAHRYKVKAVVHLRGSEFRTWFESEDFSTQKRIRRALNKCEGGIVLGNNLKYIFSTFFDENRIFVVPNGGNYAFPTRQESGKIKILFFSNLLANKGVVDLLKAVDLLYNKYGIKDFECDLVGAWFREEDKIACEEILNKSPLPVKIHPPQGGNEKWQFFANADIFVFPPRAPEGHPWAIIEAMAAALPIISTDKGAIIESVHHEFNGFIVRPASPEEIAEKIKLLIENSDLRKRMGEESKKIYLESFTEEKMVDNLTNVFNALAQKK